MSSSPSCGAISIYPDSDRDWGFYLGSGIVLYGVIIGLYGTLSMRRLFRFAAAAPDATT
jgi:hypothetical protein